MLTGAEVFPDFSSNRFSGTYTELTSEPLASSAYKWAGLPTLSNAVRIKSTTVNHTEDKTELYFAVAADMSTVSGSYTGTILITALPNIGATSNWVKSDITMTDESTLGYEIDIDANMIPVVNRLSDDSYPSDWCNYTARQWCNAVTVDPTYLATAQSSAVGAPIPEDKILGYWVYIPRYQYQVCRPNASDSITLAAGQCQDGNGNDVTSLAAPYLFNIKFQGASQKTNFDDTGGTPAVGGWATHPAFTFGSTELSGIWVSKFEASNPTTSRVAAAENIYFKPNQLGVSNNNVSAQFTMSRNIGSDGTNAHNLAALVSTMLKNDQWGAIAYLTTSVYGRGTSEIWINNCNDGSYDSNIGGNTYNDHTGWAGTSASAGGQSSCSAYTTAYNNSAQAYSGTTGVHASTTDNIYGIYDMSGGNSEYVMGNYNQTIGNSGFSILPDAEYYNNYPSSIFTNNNYITNNNQCTWITCGGHALHETRAVQSVSGLAQAWSSDFSIFVISSVPWFGRGGDSGYTSRAGVFAAHYYNGGGNTYISFRASLVGF
jgi:hypothetical protein